MIKTRKSVIGAATVLALTGGAIAMAGYMGVWGTAQAEVGVEGPEFDVTLSVDDVSGLSPYSGPISQPIMATNDGDSPLAVDDVRVEGFTITKAEGVTMPCKKEWFDFAVVPAQYGAIGAGQSAEVATLVSTMKNVEDYQDGCIGATITVDLAYGNDQGDMDHDGREDGDQGNDRDDRDDRDDRADGRDGDGRGGWWNRLGIDWPTTGSQKS